MAKPKLTSEQKAELVRTWKVQVSAKGVRLTLNGKTYELGDSHDAIVFDLERASAGYTVPERVDDVTTDQRVCAVYTDGIGCGAPVEPVPGSSTKWRHANRVQAYGHDAQPKLAHPMDTDPFAGVDGE